jgi:outer membrane protein
MFRSQLPVIALALLVAFGAAGAARAQGGVKIAVIDVQRIVSDSTAGKAALERLKKLQDEKEAQAKTRQAELTNLQDQISKGRLSLAEDKLAAMNKDLEEKAIAFRRFQDDAQREVGKARDAALGEIERKVIPIIDQVGKEGGYTLIFNKFQSGLVYADQAIDITDQIIKRFDGAGGAAPPKGK